MGLFDGGGGNFFDTFTPSNVAKAYGDPSGGIDSFLYQTHLQSDDGNISQFNQVKPKADTTPPTQGAVAPAVLSDATQRQRNIQSASTILTSGAGLLDEPSVYSASRSLLGS